MGFTPQDPDFENRKKNLEDKNSLRNQIRQEIIEELFNQLLFATLTPSQKIMDDLDMQKVLRISKRKLDYLRAKNLISYSQAIPNGQVLYTLQDALDFINKHRKNPNRKNKN